MGKANRSQSNKEAINNKRAQNNPSNPKFTGKANHGGKAQKRSHIPGSETTVHANAGAFRDEELEALRESNEPYHPWQGRFGRYQNDSDHVEVVNLYDPALELACEMLGVPYGSVGVASSFPGAISWEFRIDSKDRTCYHTPDERRAHRAPWTKFVMEVLDRTSARICKDRGITEDALNEQFRTHGRENVIAEWEQEKAQEAREKAEEAQALVLQAALDKAGI